MEHKAASFEVPELERTLAKKKKRYVNYKEGMALYSMGRDSFRKLAKDAHALLRIKKMAIMSNKERVLPVYTQNKILMKTG